jgi:hypothetical protein
MAEQDGPTGGVEEVPEPIVPTPAEQRLIDHVTSTCLPCAEMCGSKLSGAAASIYGMIGKKNRHFYNRLLELEGARCLEVGVWKGASSAALMDGNSARITFVDNWSEFGRVRSSFVETMNRFRGSNDVALVEANVFNLDPALLPHRPYDVYVYDGGHTEQNHFDALAKMLPALTSSFVYVCDDWNWPSVKDGTRRAIAELGLTVVAEWERSPPSNECASTSNDAYNCWWNGSWVAVIRKPAEPTPEPEPDVGPTGGETGELLPDVGPTGGETGELLPDVGPTGGETGELLPDVGPTGGETGEAV